MVAILEVGAFFSSLCVGRIGDIIGRRKTILYGSMIFFVGGALQTFANGMPMMLLGRIIAGVGVGIRRGRGARGRKRVGGVGVGVGVHSLHVVHVVTIDGIRGLT